MRIGCKLILSVVVFFTITGFDSCGSSNAHQPPPAGFELHTFEVLEDEIFGAVKNEAGGIGVKGDYKSDEANQTVAGNTEHFLGYSSNLVNAVGGYYTVSDGRVPAYWDIFETTGPCQRLQLIFNGLLTPKKTQDMYCVIRDNFAAFNINPASVDGSAPVDHVDLSNGSSIDQTNGTPQVVVYDALGNSYYAADATNVTQSTATAQSISAGIMLTGSYAVVVKNRNSDGTYNSVGGAQLDVSNNDPPSGGDCSDYCLCNPCSTVVRRGAKRP